MIGRHVMMVQDRPKPPIEEPPNRPKKPPVEEPEETPPKPPIPDEPPVEEPPPDPDHEPPKPPIRTGSNGLEKGSRV
jgi:hypothetical protein